MASRSFARTAAGLWIALLLLACLPGSGLRAQDQSGEAAVWTVIIPEGFPGNVYTWRLQPDGSYEEDAVNASSGRSVQFTLAGCWFADGNRMVLRQRGINFVFVGELTTSGYSGTLFLDGRPFSNFCAARGKHAPQTCSAGRATAMPPLPVGCSATIA